MTVYIIGKAQASHTPWPACLPTPAPFEAVLPAQGLTFLQRSSS